MDKIIRLPLGALASNCYLIPADDDKVIVVDPASTGEVMALIDSNDRELGAIIITHGHYDHFAGAASLHEQTGAPIYAPDLDSEMFQSAEKSWSWFMGGIPFEPIRPDHLFEYNIVVKELSELDLFAVSDDRSKYIHDIFRVALVSHSAKQQLALFFFLLRLDDRQILLPLVSSDILDHAVAHRERVKDDLITHFQIFA